MATQHLEERIIDLGKRIDVIERRLDTSDSTFLGSNSLSFVVWIRVLGWVIAGGSLLTFLITWWWADVAAWVLVVPIVAGFWLALREHAIFDISDSTLAILHEERAGKRIHARNLHKTTAKGKEKDLFSPERFANTVGLAVGTLIITLLLVSAILLWIPTLDGQLLIIAAVLIGLLVYSRTCELKSVPLLICLGLYLVLALLDSPLMSLLLTIVLTAWLGTTAFRRREFRLLTLVVVATYVVLSRWTFDTGAAPSISPAIDGIAAEMVVLASLTFALPFATLRRTAGERVQVRWLVGLNTAGYTILTLALAQRLLPNSWAVAVCSLLFAGFAIAGLAWQAHGRASYAKYFLLASLAGFLISALLFLDSGLATLVWLMVAIILLTGGFLARSYSFRLAGILVLGATVIRYLGITLMTPGTASPTFFLHDRVWIGMLLAIFLIVAGMGYRDLSTRGAEEKIRVPLVVLLYVLSALVMCSLFAVEVLGLSN